MRTIGKRNEINDGSNLYKQLLKIDKSMEINVIRQGLYERSPYGNVYEEGSYVICMIKTDNSPLTLETKEDLINLIRKAS